MIRTNEMDLFDAISNGFISALAKEGFSRLINYLIENKEKIIFVFMKTRNYRLSNNHPNTPFTFDENHNFVEH